MLGVGIIKAAMTKRGFKHRRTEDGMTVNGQYARNLQYVYSKQYQAKSGLVVDLVYFAVDILAEKLVIGFYRENPKIENGVYDNASRAIALDKLDADTLEKELDKLITPIRDHFN